MRQSAPVRVGVRVGRQWTRSSGVGGMRAHLCTCQRETASNFERPTVLALACISAMNSTSNVVKNDETLSLLIFLLIWYFIRYRMNWQYLHSSGT